MLVWWKGFWVGIIFTEIVIDASRIIAMYFKRREGLVPERNG